MRNIFVFIWRNHFVFLFLILQSFAIYLLIQNNNYQRAGFINSANKVSGNFLNAYSNITEYFSLKNANEILAAENAELKKHHPNSYFKYDVQVFNINDTIYRQQYTYRAARVVNKSVNKRNNYLTLNRGSLHGVEQDMAVITPLGVVGIVKNVSENFCTVLSMLHVNSKISAQIKNNNYFGSMVWNGNDASVVNLVDIPSHVKLHKGDTVVTTSFSTIFPEGIVVGTIEEFELKAGDNFYTIKVKPGTDFRSVTNVYVVGNLLKNEQLQLETSEEEQGND